MRMPVTVLDAPLLIRLPADVPGEAAADSLTAQVPRHMRGPDVLLVFWFRPGPSLTKAAT